MRSRSNVIAAIGDLLRDVDALDPVVLGGRPKKSRLDENTKRAFIERLEAMRTTNSRFVLGVAILYGLVTLASLALLFLSSTTEVASTRLCLGGGVASLGAMLLGLRGLWRDKSLLDVTLCTIPELDDEQAIVSLLSIYYAHTAGKPSSGRLGLTVRGLGA